MIVLDTNICIHAMKGHRAVVDRLKPISPMDLAVTSVTLAELWFGARKSRTPVASRKLQDAFVEPFNTLSFDRDAADHYARIREELERAGTPIGERDQMIAATCRSVGATLITANRREFARVPNLATEDWTH